VLKLQRPLMRRRKINNRRARKLMAANDIDGRITALDQTCRFGVGIMFTPELGIGTIVRSDDSRSPNRSATEIRLRTGNDTPKGRRSVAKIGPESA
jgi:hypothetical protein